MKFLKDISTQFLYQQESTFTTSLKVTEDYSVLPDKAKYWYCIWWRDLEEIKENEKKLLENYISLKNALDVANKKVEFLDKKCSNLGKIEDLEKEIETLKNLNKNLIRICTERANQKRGIHPKKNNMALVVLNTNERNTKNKLGQQETYWETWLQTPFHSQIGSGEFEYLMQHHFPQLPLLKKKNNYKSGFWEIMVKHKKDVDFTKIKGINP